MAGSLKLRRNETLLIGRLRRGLSQDGAAARFGVPVKIYRSWERSRPPRGRAWAVEPDRPTAQERCLVLRRRAGLTQAQVARHLGCSRWWVNQMENGNAPVRALAEFWRGRP